MVFIKGNTLPYLSMAVVFMCNFFGTFSYGNNQIHNLGKSVFSASGFEQDIKQAPASISFIKSEDIEKKPYRNLAEAIESISGVDIGTGLSKTGGLSVSIRGLPSSYTLILVDGKRQNANSIVGPNGFSQTFQGVIPPLNAIERIEVIRGPMSTLYGSDALGGVVNIITKKISNDWSSSVNVEAMVSEDFDFEHNFSTSFFTSGALIKDKLGLQLRLKEAYRTAAKPSFTWSDPSGAIHNDMAGRAEGAKGMGNLVNMGAKISYLHDEKNTFSLDVDYYNQYFDNSNSEFGTITSSDGKDGLKGGYTKNGFFNKMVSYVSHSGQYELFSINSYLQHNYSSNNSRQIVGKVSTPNLGQNRDIVAHDIILNSTSIVGIGDYNVLSIGGEYRFEFLQDKIASPSSFSQHSVAIFAEDEYQPIHPLNLLFGVRYTQNNIFGSNFTPRLYSTYAINDYLTLKGGISTGFKAPPVNELIDGIYNFSGQGLIPLYGNPNLKPETSINYEASVGYEDPNQYISVGMFYTDFRDKTQSTNFALNSTLPNGVKCESPYRSCSIVQNIDRASIFGIESMAGLNYFDTRLDVGYTFLDSKKQTGVGIGDPIDNTPRHLLNIKISYVYKYLDTYLSFKYEADRFRSDYYGDQNINEALGKYAKYYKNYALISWGIGYKFSESFRLNGGIYNILGNKFSDYVVYNTGTQYSAQNKYQFLQEGRRYWISIISEF